ncbi:hypothetical protein EXIGLDRAFT_736572, partial [Exidia glandulosa HHB12029]
MSSWCTTAPRIPVTAVFGDTALAAAAAHRRRLHFALVSSRHWSHASGGAHLLDCFMDTYVAHSRRSVRIPGL